ncbi:4Fe-4S binding protein [Holdemania filiformis]|uniref:4Fe-4S binding protein n=1 Tax=Holdemania filiformis TaxID=61171 RepID=UPI00266F19F2|nr:4Fe-4S binding protein [Holdemania filiformis]
MRLVTMKFSASQTTAKVVDQLCTGLGLPRRDLNLNEGASLGPQDCLIAAFPVFSGRLPAFFKAWMDQIQGRDTPAVAVVVYGNRAYEDALLELSDALETGGFTVVGAATVVAQHSIFPAVANGRPDAADAAGIASFAQALLEKGLDATHPMTSPVPGQRPYRKITALPLKPQTNSRCLRCGRCAAVCPVQAIDPAQPRLTDKTRCVSCTACIQVCPVGARQFPPALYYPARFVFQRKMKQPRQPEWFL